MASSSSSTSPCAACKFLRRKCQPECVFAPYFPPDQPQKFANVHKVFGASNVTKLLNELLPHQREDAVNSLAYEADMRLRDPVYGCVGVISLLQHQLRQLQLDLSCAKSELSKYQNLGPINHHQSLGGINNLIAAAGGGGGGAAAPHHHHHQHQFFPRDHHHHHPAIAAMNGYDAASSLFAMNVSANLGGQFHQVPRTEERGRNIIDPS
ncbi:hypothetical protein SAY86_031095 [Trapa natans]|uniref:LOB domain-containing protein n=1 Tax=Trapa natans TaxID=22666 RepID=A0AAN7RB78_TRANT|nr:hypothetical protein SAY86_031095 [Trapa natans]